MYLYVEDYAYVLITTNITVLSHMDNLHLTSPFRVHHLFRVTLHGYFDNLSGKHSTLQHDFQLPRDRPILVWLHDPFPLLDTSDRDSSRGCGSQRATPAVSPYASATAQPAGKTRQTGVEISHPVHQAGGGGPRNRENPVERHVGDEPEEKNCGTP